MKYNGMTVLERLYISGQLEEYDNAIKEKNTEKVIKILHSIELNDRSILPILKHEGLQDDS